MEEVLAQLSEAHLSEPAPGSGFDALFKNRGRHGSQEERRRWLLDTQKKHRNDKIDHTRGIMELVEAVETEMEWCGGDTGARYAPERYVAGFHRRAPSFRNTLMLSEWLVERPEDFSDNWYIVPCPKGTRVLLVAKAGRTKLFTKHGQFLTEVRSVLPGGGPADRSRSHSCVLDGVWHRDLATLHVLDLLAWNNQPMTDCDVEFRQFWLTGKIEECPELRVLNKKNQLIVKLLPKVPCSVDLLNEFMMRHPPFPDNCPPLDGLLLYHKRAHYTAGSTPLVGWLYPFMVPEVLGAEITVHPKFLECAPADYAGQADYITRFEQKHDKRSRRSRLLSASSVMSTQSDGDKDEHNADKKPEKHISNNSTMETETAVASESRLDGQSMESEAVTSSDDTKLGSDDETGREMARVVDNIVGPQHIH